MPFFYAQMLSLRKIYDMKRCLFLLFITLFIFSSCNQKSLKKVHFTGVAQGTYYSIAYYDVMGRDFQDDIDSILTAFDQSVSVYQPNSIVSKVNRNEDVELDDWFIQNFKLSQQISEASDGLFDITIGPLANVWGFGTFDQPGSIDKSRIDSAKQFVGFHRMRLENSKIIKDDEHMQLNFNAIAQGYAVDVLADFIDEQGIDDYLIDLGGEIFAKGEKPNGDKWKIGIEIPEDGAEERFYNRIVSIQNEAVATSGNYRKYYEIDGIKYAHTLNPKTGYPVKHSLLSTTVIGPSAAIADAYATAFMVMGKEKTLEFVKNKSEIKVYLMFDEEGKIKSTMSKNFEPYLSVGSE